MPTLDRYSAAVHARRRELRHQLDLLTGAHRAELRDALTPVRAAASADLLAALTDLRREIDTRTDLPDLPLRVDDAVRMVAQRAHLAWAARARAAVRRVAAGQGMPLPAGWPAVPPAPAPAARPPGPRPVGTGDVLADAGTWRLAVLPLAVAPLTGLAGPALLLPAVGAAAVVLWMAVRARRAAVRRERVRRWAAELLADTRARVDAELVARTAALLADDRFDTALTRHRSALATELSRLDPHGA